MINANISYEDTVDPQGLNCGPDRYQGVNFINVFARIFHARFSYKRLFSSYVLRKTRAKTVGEIDPRCQFYQQAFLYKSVFEHLGRNSQNFLGKIKNYKVPIFYQ